MRRYVLSYFLLLTMAACSVSHKTDYVSDTPIVSPSVGNSSVFTATPVTSTALLPTATRFVRPTPVPYPAGTKPNLISYEFSVVSADPDILCLEGTNSDSFVLYDDGQLIFKDEGIFMESYLSREDINNLLAQIEYTGFFEVEGDGTRRPLEEEPIYVEPPNNVGGFSGEILVVKDKVILIDYALRDYLVHPIKETLELILNYRPSSSHTYEPEYVGFRIFPAYGDIGIATPISPVDEWSSSLPSLLDLMNASDEYYGYIDDAMTSKIKELFRVYPSRRVFTDGDQKYHVITCVYLPR